MISVGVFARVCLIFTNTEFPKLSVSWLTKRLRAGSELNLITKRMLPTLSSDLQQLGDVFLASEVVTLVESGGAHTCHLHVRYVDVHGAASDVAVGVGHVGVAALEESVELLVGNVQHGLWVYLFQTETVERNAAAFLAELRQVGDQPLDVLLDVVGLLLEQGMATAQVLVAENEDLMLLDELNVLFREDTGDHVDDHVVAHFVDDGEVFLVGRVGQRDTDTVDEFFLDVAEDLVLVALEVLLVHGHVGDHALFLQDLEHPFQIRMCEGVAAADCAFGSSVERTEHGFHADEVAVGSLDGGVFVTVDTAAVAVVGNLDVEVLREVVGEVVLVVLDPDVGTVLEILFPVSGRLDLSAVLEDYDRVVAVDVASEDFLRDEHSKLFLFHALNIAQIGVCVNTIRRLIMKYM